MPNLIFSYRFVPWTNKQEAICKVVQTLKKKCCSVHSSKLFKGFIAFLSPSKRYTLLLSSYCRLNLSFLYSKEISLKKWKDVFWFDSELHNLIPFIMVIWKCIFLFHCAFSWFISDSTLSKCINTFPIKESFLNNYFLYWPLGILLCYSWVPRLRYCWKMPHLECYITSI